MLSIGLFCCPGRTLWRGWIMKSIREADGKVWRERGLSSRRKKRKSKMRLPGEVRAVTAWVEILKTRG